MTDIVALQMSYVDHRATALPLSFANDAILQIAD